MSRERIRTAMANAEIMRPGQPLRPINVADLVTMKLPPRRNLLAPWLPEKGLAMAFAARGVGKTHFGLSTAYAVASGGDFLRFNAPEPRRTLYLDGEMPATALQERVKAIALGAERPPPDADYLQFLAADMTENGLPDLATPDGQASLAPYLEGFDLIVVDNVSTLARLSRENEADSWAPIQDWILAQRRAGRSVLLIHHAGKGGQQRGTSKREDVLDTVIALRRPSADYNPVQGARFEVHFEKARGFFGAEAEPFEAQYETRDGQAVWSIGPISNPEAALVSDLHRRGMSVRKISEAAGLSKSQVHRMVQALDGEELR